MNLFVRRGPALVPVTPAEARQLAEKKTGTILKRGGDLDEYQPMKLYSADGAVIGYASWNCRLWLGDPSAMGNKEIPVPDIKTAAEHEAEGWKDYRV